MSEQANKPDLKRQMPETAKWVEARRAEWGKVHVNDCIRQALAGKPNQFYAVENGHVLGTPFATAIHGEAVDLMTKFGGVGVWMMRRPDGSN